MTICIRYLLYYAHTMKLSVIIRRNLAWHHQSHLSKLLTMTDTLTLLSTLARVFKSDTFLLVTAWVVIHTSHVDPHRGSYNMNAHISVSPSA